jgi:hypothetical protein
MRCRCPFCSHRFWQARNLESAQFCRKCHRLFMAPPEARVPPWVLGVVVVLMANCQIMSHHSAALAAVQIEQRSPDGPQGGVPLCLPDGEMCDSRAPASLALPATC